MSTTQQPEALRLAEQYDYGDPAAHSNTWKVAVCTELRRQHAELETLTLYKSLADEYGLSIFKDLKDLGDAGSDVQLLRMGYAAARLEIESLRADLRPDPGAYPVPQPARAQQPAIMPKGESAAAHLRAMATNYPAGHLWDKLDAKACIRGALEIEALRAPHAQAPAQLGHGGEREAFEASQYINYPAASLRRSHGATRLDNGEYLCAITQVAWEAWQARAAHGQAPAQAAPAAVADCTRSHPHENMDNACRAKAAIAEMQSMAVRGAEATAQDLERFVSMLAAAPTTQPAPQQEAQEPVKLSDEQIKAHGDKASRMMARDLTRFDAACEVDKYLREQGAPGYYRHRMSIVLFGNVEGTEAARAPDTAPQPSPAAQGDALDTERLDFLIEHRAYVVSDETSVYGYWLHYVEPDGATSVQVSEYETPREAIDAARAAQEGKSNG